MTDYRRTDAGFVTPEREERQLAKLEVRSTDDGAVAISGYATVYNYPYSIAGGPDAGGFTEVVSRGAAAKSASEADVRLLVDHTGVPLARTKSGTLQLESDDIGLRVSAELDPSNPVAAQVRSAMERGDLDQMSFAFKVLRDEWSPDYTKRTISEVKLYDVSLVTFPANPATVAKLREDDEHVEAEVAVPGRSLALARRQWEAVTKRDIVVVVTGGGDEDEEGCATCPACGCDDMPADARYCCDCGQPMPAVAEAAPTPEVMA
jgi:hypothetical protein